MTNFYLNNVSGSTLGNNTVASLQLSNSSSLTTTGAANLSGNINLYSASTLTFGASMTVGGYLDVGQNCTLNMAGYRLSADTVYLGWDNGGPPFTLLNRGAITVTSLYVNAGGQSFSLAPSDSAARLTLYNVSGSTLGSNSVANLLIEQNSLLNTTNTANVTYQVDVESGSKLTLGADMNLGYYFNLQDTGSTLDMGGHKITTATEIDLAWGGSGVPTIVNRGPLSTTSLYVKNQPFSLAAADSVARLYLYNVSASTLGANSVANLLMQSNSLLNTTNTANVTYQLDVETGSKLTLGADMNLGYYFNLQDTGSTLDMNGHGITAAYIYLGWAGSGVPSLVNRGPLSATNFYVADQPFSLAPSDSAAKFILYNVSGSTLGSNSVANLLLEYSSQLNTTNTANVTYQVDVESGSKLTLGADMKLGYYFNLQDTGSTLDMGGHGITAATEIDLGWYGSGVPTIVNRGPLSTISVYAASQPFSLIPADSISKLHLYNVSPGARRQLGG